VVNSHLLCQLSYRGMLHLEANRNYMKEMEKSSVV